jgi:hypothetical protein
VDRYTRPPLGACIYTGGLAAPADSVASSSAPHEQAATMVLDRPPTSSGAKASTAATDTNQGSSVRASSQSSEGAVG